MTKYVSNLANRINDFINFKRSLGYKYTNKDYYLSFIDKANLELGNYDYLTKEVMEEAFNKSMSKCNSQYRGFISYYREISKYLNTLDNCSYILPDSYIARNYHAQIYLFSNEEISKFFKTLKSLVIEGDYKPNLLVLEAIYTILYFCGVRCIEARMLETKDVYLDDGYLIIRNSKNHNDRKLYLTDELITIFKEYDKKISMYVKDRRYFFSYHQYDYQSSTFISSNFKQIWKQAGLKVDTKPKPRAYDFRHHFACANIMKWMDEGKDVHSLLPYLMTYMGHSDLKSTYYYVHLIPEFMNKYNDLSSISNKIVPEVEDYEI